MSAIHLDYQQAKLPDVRRRAQENVRRVTGVQSDLGQTYLSMAVQHDICSRYIPVIKGRSAIVQEHQAFHDLPKDSYSLAVVHCTADRLPQGKLAVIRIDNRRSTPAVRHMQAHPRQNVRVLAAVAQGTVDPVSMQQALPVKPLHLTRQCGLAVGLAADDHRESTKTRNPSPQPVRGRHPRLLRLLPSHRIHRDGPADLPLVCHRRPPPRARHRGQQPRRRQPALVVVQVQEDVPGGGPQEGEGVAAHGSGQGPAAGCDDLRIVGVHPHGSKDLSRYLGWILGLAQDEPKTGYRACQNGAFLSLENWQQHL
mmetsp:Transcript_12838/g.32017  ORF Transcript_12838/g.32017 Transcript_12838/m.32017 type:complete len:311 (+) Transcript_12838:401-1333(+)